MRALIMSAQVAQAILSHAQAQRPEECCGALLARGESSGSLCIERAVPLENDAAAPRTHYSIPARSLLNLERAVVLDGLHVAGFYHSHPAGAPAPSETDCAAAVPWYAYVIAGFEPDTGHESLRAYTFAQGAPAEVTIEIMQRASSP